MFFKEIEMNRKITTIIWDLDGTIIDSLDLHLAAFQQVLPAYGIDLTREKFIETFGRSNSACLQEFFGRELEPDFVTHVVDTKEAIYRNLLRDNLQPLPGVLEWVDYFDKQGMKQALASSAPPENIDAALSELNLRRYFKLAMSGEDFPSKPEPDLFLETARRLGSHPAECVVIEDSVAGVMAGNAAGMITAAIVGTQSEDELPAGLILEDYQGSPEEFLRELSRLHSG